MKLIVPALAATLSWAALAADPPKSLNQARGEINNGTWAGTTIYKSKPKAETAEAAASGASAAQRRGLFGLGEPPSGVPKNKATQLDSPTQGIAVPTAATAASAAGR